MSSFDPTLGTALQQSVIRGFTAVQVILPDYTIQLIDGSGFVTLGGMTFTGLDPVFGTISTISALSAAFATQAPSLSICLMPPNTSGIVNLNNPLYQGSAVNVWIGVVDQVSGQCVGTPYYFFDGRLDTALSTVNGLTQIVQMNVASVFDRMFIAEEASRLNGQYHKSIHPGETGLDLNVQAMAQPFWGSSAPTNPKYPTLPIAPTLGDRLSGQNTPGVTYGNTYGF